MKYFFIIFTSALFFSCDNKSRTSLTNEDENSLDSLLNQISENRIDSLKADEDVLDTLLNQISENNIDSSKEVLETQNNLYSNKDLKKDYILLDYPQIGINSNNFYKCEDILSKTPKTVNLKIYEDTIIEMNQFDERVNIKLKFNWLFVNGFTDWSNKIGVYSIELILDGKIVSKIDLKDILTVEAFKQDDPNSERYGQTVREDIYLEDVNLDSYLDIKIGRSWFSYFIYNTRKKVFEYKENLNSMRVSKIDCENKIIYSYGGGTAWYNHRYAYKIIDGEINLYQSLYNEYNEHYILEQFKDSSGAILFSDTTFRVLK